MDKSIGLIAGNGQFPILFAQAAKVNGWTIHATAYKEETDPDLSNYVDTLEWLHIGQGIVIKPSTFLLPDLLAPPGVWTRRKPSKAEHADIEMGWPIAKEMGRLDIGQCIVVGGGSVLAVEAIEGTDAAILRGGQLGKGKAVVVKVCKPDQDQRFDIPAVGLETIQTMHRADVRTLALEAGKATVFDRPSMIKPADDYKMAIIAITDQESATH